MEKIVSRGMLCRTAFLPSLCYGVMQMMDDIHNANTMSNPAIGYQESNLLPPYQRHSHDMRVPTSRDTSIET